MMKATSVRLCHEITRNDALTIIDWLQDHQVTEYLNEQQNVCSSIYQVIERVNLPVLTHLFNRDGRFMMIHTGRGRPIGFVRLVPRPDEAEIVIVIGDREQWGKGYGSSAIRESLKLAFFELRVPKIVAKSHTHNARSLKVFVNAGFKVEKELPHLKRFGLTMDEFLKII